MDIRNAKKELRKKILAVRDNLSKEAWQEGSRVIFERLITLNEFMAAQKIFIFINFRSEVDTKPIIEYLLKKGKKVIVPYTDVKNKTLKLYYLNNFDELVEGSYGILEPDPKKAIEANIEDVDLVIVPGSVFDEKGGRIGYGGGFYDRLLPSIRKEVKTVAISFDFQVIEEVPMGYYDRRVDIIVTDKRVIKCT